MIIVCEKYRNHQEEEGLFCDLFSLETHEKVTTRILFTDQCPTDTILLSPTTLHNLSRVLNQSRELTLKTKYIFKLCDREFSPTVVKIVKIQGIKTPLFNSIPYTDVLEEVLHEYFDTDRYVYDNSVVCLDVSKYLNCKTVAISPLLKNQSKIFFHIDIVQEENIDEDGDEVDKLSLFHIKRFSSCLSLGTTLQVPLPPESKLTNFSVKTRNCLKYFERTLTTVENIYKRYQKSLIKCPDKQCLKMLVSGSQGTGSGLLCEALAGLLGYSLDTINCADLVGDTSGSSEALIKRIGVTHSNDLHTIIVLDNLEMLVHDKEKNFDERAYLALEEVLCELNSSIVVIGLCLDLLKLHPRVASLFLHHVELPALTVEDRREILLWYVARDDIILDQDLDVQKWAKLTSGFNFADLGFLLDFAQDELDDDEAAVSDDNMTAAMAAVQAARSDSLGLATIPSVKWEEVGGLEEARQEIMEAISSPAGDIRRSGILLYGPPGVGKTLLAKAVATESCQNFISVKGPELLNMYVGQSEENVRQVFVRAREAQPCVVFFDELDSLAPSRGQNGDSGGVMDRVVSSLLTQLDRLDQTEVTVIGATNRPDLVDPALLRPGRMDRMVYLGVTKEPGQKLLILQALTRSMLLASDCDLASISQKLASGLTGADLGSLVSEAAMTAIQRTVQRMEATGEQDIEARVNNQDFMEALQKLHPSVSEEELQSYEYLKQNLRK